MNGHPSTPAATDRPRIGKKGDEGFGLVEVMIAMAIGSIGILAVAGLQIAAATQSRVAEWRTTQALAAQQVFEQIHRGGYAAAASGSYMTTVGGDSIAVALTVSNSALRVRQLSVVVPAMGSVNARTFVRRLYQPRPLPASP